MVNISGVLKLAATVCPASTLREITMPLIGAAMVVRSRSTLAESTDAWRILMLASAWWSETRFCWYSDSETSFAVKSSWLRLKLNCASSRPAWALARSATARAIERS